MNLLIIKTLTDGKVTRSLLNYPTENEALSALYYELWYATSNADVVSVVAEIITEYGNVTKCERFVRASTPEIVESEDNAE